MARLKAKFKSQFRAQFEARAKASLPAFVGLENGRSRSLHSAACFLTINNSALIEALERRNRPRKQRASKESRRQVPAAERRVWNQSRKLMAGELGGLCRDLQQMNHNAVVPH